MEFKKVKKAYEKAVMQMIEIFAEKQEMKFDGWTGELGTWANFGDYSFLFDDILLDLSKDMPKGFILKWQNDCILTETQINYRSYIMVFGENLKEK